MADITQIQVGSTTYDIRDGKHTIFIVKGTQTASTNAFKGDLLDIDELYEGLMIQYWLPFAGTSSSATLNLTLKNGVKTGAIPMYVSGTSRITTHQVANSYMIYVYHTIMISGTEYTGWWAQRAYDSNTTYSAFANLYHQNGAFVADSVIYRYQLLFHLDADRVTPLNNVSNSTGTSKAMLTDVTFDPFGEILYYITTTTISKDGVVGASNTCYAHGQVDLRYTFNCGSTLTQYKDVYIQVIMQSDGSCKIANSMPLVQDLPTTADGFHYIYLGRAGSAYQISLYPYHPVYYHDGTSLRKLENIDNATIANPGLMSAADKAKLDSLNYSAPTFSNNTLYYPGTYVSYNGSLYRFKVLHESGAWNSSEVTAVNYIGNDLSGIADMVANDFDTGIPYSIGDYVNYNGFLYRFTVDHNAGAWNISHVTLVEGLASDVKNKAPLASPALTGIPTAPTAADGTNTTQIATTAFVQSAFKANDAMVFKGTIGSSGATVTTLPAKHYQGWTYKVITAGTYAGKACEIGDMIICITDGTSANNAHWTVVQSNIDGAVTGPTSSSDTHVAIFDGTSGKVIKDSGFTIAKSIPSDAVFTDTTYSNGNGISLSGTTFSAAFPTSGTPSALGTASNGTSNNVARADHVHAKPTYSKSDVGLGNVTNDAQVKAAVGTTKGDMVYWSAANTPARLGVGSNGQVLKVVSGVPTWSSAEDSDTKVTNTLETTTKYYVTGTVAASTNTGTQSFDTGVYVTTEAGQLNAATYKVNEQVTLQWNATDESLDFVFA